MFPNDFRFRGQPVEPSRSKVVCAFRLPTSATFFHNYGQNDLLVTRSPAIVSLVLTSTCYQRCTHTNGRSHMSPVTDIMTVPHIRRSRPKEFTLFSMGRWVNFCFISYRFVSHAITIIIKQYTAAPRSRLQHRTKLIRSVFVGKPLLV